MSNVFSNRKTTSKNIQNFLSAYYVPETPYLYLLV